MTRYSFSAVHCILVHCLVSVVQGYHELYGLQRGRLEAQLLQMTEERDCWIQLTISLALKVYKL